MGVIHEGDGEGIFERWNRARRFRMNNMATRLRKAGRGGGGRRPSPLEIQYPPLARGRRDLLNRDSTAAQIHHCHQGGNRPEAECFMDAELDFVSHSFEPGIRRAGPAYEPEYPIKMGSHSPCELDERLPSG